MSKESVFFGDLFAVSMFPPHLESELAAVCNDIGVDYTVGGFIAKCAFGYVFEVVDNETAERMALKVFLKEPADNHFHFRIDCEFRRGRLAFEVFPEHVIPPRRYVVRENCGAILFEKVGHSLNLTLSKRHRLLLLLAQLHLRGYYHGDAKVSNILELDDKLYFIDFSTFSKFERFSPVSAIIDDVGTLFASCGWPRTEGLLAIVENYARIVCDASMKKKKKKRRVAAAIQSMVDAIDVEISGNANI